MNIINIQNSSQALPKGHDPVSSIEKSSTVGASGNALTHGVYAKKFGPQIVAEGEGLEEFLSLLASVTEDLNPEGINEEAEVTTIAQLHWGKDRLIRDYSQSRGMQAASPLLQPGELVFSGKHSELNDFMSVFKETGIADAIKSKDPNTVLTPAQREALKALRGGGGPKNFDVMAKDLERFLKLSAMIDSRIDKAMGRLVAFKEYKRQYAKTVTNVK